MSIGKAIDQTLTAGVLLALLGGAGYFASIAAVNVVPMVWESWSRNWARLQANEARVERIRQESQEEVFRVVCPDYFEQGFVGRHMAFRSLRWCEDYRERM
ncbi:hypothetical protein FY136_28735 (plasmid) [Agrobacterium tumefaciens]|uniref:hypothetical protein n=1 Tax=Agrobacterium tumefaciens TaxID=358 RepID=UPI0021CE2464|nr:hypothetical protein [Agrobacterium tumefaciens]UXT53250.1 hypothetical protein FY136_28735 [Agrobacterium tumefaciens]